MGNRAPRYAIVLAAGEGTRMGSTTRHKVCFTIDGQPAINRAIKIYNECGVKQHILVVGALAGQVIETVGAEFDNVIFTYQAERLGTAHAAQQALKVLEGLESEQDVLLVAGDRVIRPAVLEQLFDLYFSQNCDMAVLATLNRQNSNQGRLVMDDNRQLLGVVEAADVRQRRVYRKLRTIAGRGSIPECEELLQIVTDGFAIDGKVPENSKLKRAFGELWQALAVDKRSLSAEEMLTLIPQEMTRFEFIYHSGKTITKTPQEIEETDLLNTSVYLIKTDALRYTLPKLDRNNAQQEEYLSEMVNQLTGVIENGEPKYTVKYLPVEDPTSVLGFNNPSELLEVEALIQSKREKEPLEAVLPKNSYRPVELWLTSFQKLENPDSKIDDSLWAELTQIYGDTKETILERVRAYIDILKHTAGTIGKDEKVFIIRSPGRVNAMGRHIDHQGGNCNLMTIGYETLMVVRPREDDLVRIFSVNPEHFPNREFSIREMVEDLPWDDWLSLVNSEKVSKMVHTYGGDWVQYIKAAVLRLQKKFRTDKLCGMDLVVSGNIPIAAGLSSSSSLVVGAAEATVAVNRLDTFPAQLVDLCGEGEWFVGTRGGAADHAAVKFGQKGKVVKVTFFDFRILDIVPFPANYALVVCDSGLKAQKTGNARDLFNHRVSCYRIGFLLIKKFFPQFAPALKHLRDVNMNHLNVPLSWIYRILLHLPEKATREELRAMLPDEDLDVFFNQHNPPTDGLYAIRGVVLFGFAEMERAKLFSNAMQEGRIDYLGRLMNVSHDGDRVIAIDTDGNESEYGAPTSNDHILSLIDDLESGDLERVNRAQLQWQPGSYDCSLPEIDRMVYIALQTKGVVGAQLAGAGLGGCMMVLAHREAVSSLINNLDEQYYKPHDKPPTVLVCRPVAGSGVLLREVKSEKES
jgi:N-acetylgalactosamine kinase